MGIFEGCLLASDIDGTLLDDGYIHPSCIDKIKFFVEQGGVFAIATGRSVGAVSMVTDAVDCVGPSVVANGAMIYDYKNQKIIKEHLLPECDKAVVECVMASDINVGIEIHSGKKVLVVNATNETEDHERYEALKVENVLLSEAREYSWTKILFAFNDTNEREIIEKRIMQLDIKSDLFNTIAYIDGRTRYYLEVIPKGISKASSLKELYALLNVKHGGFFAIGDYYNDVAMLESADIAAVPNNSPDEIKKLAKIIVSDAKNGAVADFIDYLTEKFKN